MVSVEPIDEATRDHVATETRHCIARANDLLETDFPPVPVSFDLIGRTAGMYRVVAGRAGIRYNPYLFAKYFDENLTTTVPHEVAHYLTDKIYGYSNVRAHGREWRRVMQMLGANDAVRCDFDLEGIPVRRYQKLRYACRCRFHEITKVRHNRIVNKGQRYFCRACRSELVAAYDD